MVEVVKRLRIASRGIAYRPARTLFRVGWVALGAFLFDGYCRGGCINLVGDLWSPYLVVTLAWGFGAFSDAWLSR